MGEIADMMLDGTLCECCGVFIDDDPPRRPRYCSTQCKADRTLQPVAKVKCPICKKKVKHNGLTDHVRDVHERRKLDLKMPAELKDNPPYVRHAFNSWKNPEG